MASTGSLGDAPTVIDDLDQVQDLRPPPLAHIIDRPLSLRRGPKQDHLAALSEKEAQTNDGLLQNYGLHDRSEDISQAYRSEKEAGIKCNYCFLCFRKGTKVYIIKVFFAWPSRKVVKVEELLLAVITLPPYYLSRKHNRAALIVATRIILLSLPLELL